MRTVLCLLAALAGADAAVINCQNWDGNCPSDKTKSDDTCESTPPSGRSSDVLAGEQACSANVCCRPFKCADVVTCPSAYTTKDLSCTKATEEKGHDSAVLGVELQPCTEQLCCESTCGAAVTCPAKQNSFWFRHTVCVPQDPEDQAGSRSAHVLATRCVVESCCLDTCASGWTCPDNLNSAQEAKATCVKPGGTSPLPLKECSQQKCCRESCKSQGHVCPEGRVPGTYELNACVAVRPPGTFLRVCSDDACCEPLSRINRCVLPFSGRDYECRNGAKPKANMATVACLDRFCNEADCCDSRTCAEADADAFPVLCHSPLGTQLKANASEIACMTPGVADGDSCSRAKCCDPIEGRCADDAACRADGDSGATCLMPAGVCRCTALYGTLPHKAEGVVVQSCHFNRLWFTVTFPDGDYDKLMESWHLRSNIRDVLYILLGRTSIKIKYRRGSIVLYGEAEVLFDSVSQAAIGAAVQGAAPQSVLGSRMEVSFSKESHTCASTDAGALEAVKATVNGKEECVPTSCDNRNGYQSLPVDNKCVSVRSGGDDGLSTGAKVGIALGVIAFVAIVVGVVVLVVLKGGKSAEAAPVENEPAADVKEMSNEV